MNGRSLELEEKLDNARSDSDLAPPLACLLAFGAGAVIAREIWWLGAIFIFAALAVLAYGRRCRREADGLMSQMRPVVKV